MAGPAAALAALRATSAELDDLGAIIDNMADTSSFAEYRRLDARFHVVVATAGRSRRFTQAEVSVQAELNRLAQIAPEPSARALSVWNGHHRAIVEAIASGDPPLARSRMEDHARSTDGWLRELQPPTLEVTTR